MKLVCLAYALVTLAAGVKIQQVGYLGDIPYEAAAQVEPNTHAQEAAGAVNNIRAKGKLVKTNAVHGLEERVALRA